jgi:hypothetical protein
MTGTQMLRRQIVLDLSVSMGTRIFLYKARELYEHSGAQTASAREGQTYANIQRRSRSCSRLRLVVRYVNKNSTKETH